MAASTNQRSGGPVVPRQLSWRRKAAVAVALPLARLLMKNLALPLEGRPICARRARAR